jgi:hypothetical protein
MREFSKKAIWLATFSINGDRLVEIAQEHTRLARDLIVNRLFMSQQDKEIFVARIEQLRLEREEILEQFERQVSALNESDRSAQLH